MGPTTHQTVRLMRGKHRSGEEGACVLELASLLADEPFTDHPVSVCPVIGAFLRAYNDSLDDERRLDLYSYASRVVGSRGTPQLCRARLDRLIAWASERYERRWQLLLLPALVGRLAPGLALDFLSTRAVHALSPHDDRTHAEALALIDDLLTLGVGDQPPPTPAPSVSDRETDAALDLIGGAHRLGGITRLG